VMIDLFGFIVFLLPGMALMLYFSWPMFVQRYVSQEMSQNVGGLILWPATFMLPLGFGLLILQGIAEVIKRIGWLRGEYEMDTHYERPLQ
jgi:TRAP-type mannitol/chloroaromatic compound transport system permease small subunit